MWQPSGRAGSSGATSASASPSSSSRRRREAMEETLWQSIERLAPLSPSFVSVTYGAGGSTRERTHATVARLLAETPLRPAAHLTCVAATRERGRRGRRAPMRRAGVRHIVALRGDPAGGIGSAYQPHPDGYDNAAALVAGIRAARRFRDFGRRLSGEASGKPEHRRRHRHAEAQGRRRRQPRHHPVLLRQRPVRSLCRARPRRRHQYPDRARHRAGPQFLADLALRRALRRLGATPGSASASRASTTIRRRASSSPPRSPPSRCSTWSIAASPISISTR